MGPRTRFRVSTNRMCHPRHMVANPPSGSTKDAENNRQKRYFDSEAEEFTDRLGIFNGPFELGHAHTKRVEQHRRCRAGTKVEGARSVNAVLSKVKRTLGKNSHSRRLLRYSHRYLRQAAWRYKQRFNLRGILSAPIHNSMGGERWSETRLRGVIALGSGGMALFRSELAKPRWSGFGQLRVQSDIRGSALMPADAWSFNVALVAGVQGCE